ncbi:MAG: ACT domain-containing protein [Deltaproteobacteria bacterium]|nr:ACT domain-containing protein [Deltaproteobacteria bacterium]MBW2136214.1 ACT domain-containing protein [Deltaproteobacteria bacterium]
MEKVVISILGRDRPGIVAAVSKILSEGKCNIEDVSQTILQTEFAGIFIVSLPDDLRSLDLLERLEGGLRSLDINVRVKGLEPAREEGPSYAAEPFVVTTFGTDRIGLVAGVTEVMARFGVNITNLKAVFRGGDDPNSNIMIYEVDVPLDIELESFRDALRKRAAELGQDINIQHRDIFEAINRV